MHVIRQLNVSLTDTLKHAEALGYEGRLKRLTPALDQAFDLDYMARLALGRQWQNLSPAERDRWRKTFKAMTYATYAGRFNHYSGQSFDILREEPGNNNTVMVWSRVIDPEGENVDLCYRLYETDGKWKVIDIYLKGTVSEVALRRSEYASVLKRDGFDALLTLLNGKIADLAAGRVKG